MSWRTEDFLTAISTGDYEEMGLSIIRLLPAPFEPRADRELSGRPKVSSPHLDSAHPSVPASSRARKRDTEDSSSHHRDRSFRRRLQVDIVESLVEASSDSGAFWTLYNRLRRKTNVASPISLDDLTAFFSERMNPPSDAKDKFDAVEMDRLRTWLASLPPVTKASSSFPSLQQYLSIADVERGKAHLLTSHHGKGTGWDGVAYSTIMEMDNGKLLRLLNECLRSRSVPNAWRATLVSGVPKKGKDRRKPEGYRPIALESCILRFLTLLIHLRFTDAMEKENILPPSQNGFREGFRTNNNCFVLRTMIDKAFATRNSLYVAFIDISNAFPSTSHAGLWETLYNYGMTGIYFDWLRVLYAEMAYHVTVNGEISAEFRSLCGVLAGDPLSPTLWNIFLSTFSLTDDESDVSLWGRCISHLEHADDMAIIASTPEGLQRKLDQVHKWCTDHFLQVNASKSAIMIFGQLPRAFPDVRLGGVEVPFVPRWSYIGVMFESTEKGIFKGYYEKSARTALQSFWGMMSGVEGFTGRRRLPPRVAKQLYTALVDCHLISGADISPDTSSASLSELERAQVTCLRRILGLSNHSWKAFLFTETGILPIRYRRAGICLRYLAYLVGLPDSHYAKAALLESSLLFSQGHSSWWGDLQRCLVSLDPNLRLPDVGELSPKDVGVLESKVRDLGFETMATELETSKRGYLLHGRREPSESGKAVPKPACLRHYLTEVDVARHRRLLTRLLADDLRPTSFSRLDSTAASTCQCGHIDTVEHALFQCHLSSDVIGWREEFYENVGVYGIAEPAASSDAVSLKLFQSGLLHWEAVRHFAAFVYKVCMHLKQPHLL